MFNEKRDFLYRNYNNARKHFIEDPDILIQLEHYITCLVNKIITANFPEIVHDYNEASFLYPFWADYPPEDRGRAPIGDQVPWIEVGEHSVGHKLSRLIAQNYQIREIGFPSGADNRFLICSHEIHSITHGLTNCAFIHLDIKSVGPRDNFDHTVLSPNQVSGDGLWTDPAGNMNNSPLIASGKRASHFFYPAISPVYSLSDNKIAPSIHLFIKPVYQMLSLGADGRHGQPLDCIKSICVPNGLLLTCAPQYLARYPGLFFPGKDDKGKDPRKVRVRVSFEILRKIAPWRVSEFSAGSHVG